MPSVDAIGSLNFATPGEEAATIAHGDQARPDDWSTLMARGQEGDQRAYLALLKAVTPYLRAHARRCGLSGDEIEDGVQDVLLTLHEIRHTYDPKRPFTPWLVAVARHRLIDRARRRFRISARESELTDAQETFAAEESNLHERISDTRRLHSAIAALPVGQRQAIEMLRLKELSLKKASAMSGQSEIALKVAVHRAVKLALGTALVAALAAVRGLRPDLAMQLQDPAFLVKVAGAWLTAVTATLAAFQLSLPDRRRAWLFLPLPSMTLWLYGFAAGCLAHWVAIPAGAPVLAESVNCLETILMASIPLALVLWLMLRQAKPLRPASTAWIGGLAVAAFADMAHLLIHAIDASLLVLVVNLVPVIVIVMLGGLLGRRMLDPLGATH